MCGLEGERQGMVGGEQGGGEFEEKGPGVPDTI